MVRKTADEIARLSFEERYDLANRYSNRWMWLLAASGTTVLVAPFAYGILTDAMADVSLGLIFVGSLAVAGAIFGDCFNRAIGAYNRTLGSIYGPYGIDRRNPTCLDNLKEGTVLDSFDHVLSDGQRGTASLISMGPDAEPQLVFAPDQPTTVQLLDTLPVSPLAPALEARP